MDLRKDDVLNRAVHSLDDYLGQAGSVSAQGDTLMVLNRKFVYAVRESLDKAGYNLVAATLKERMQETGLPGIIVCGAMPQDLMTIAKEDGIFTLDGAGNCEISPDGGPYLSVRGRKSVQKNRINTTAFRTAGLKVLYYLLLDRNNIRQSLREVKAHTEVSLGTVKNVIDALYPTFCVDTKKGRSWKNMRGALDLWTEAYHQLLKPHQALSRLDFTRDGKQHWREIALPEGMDWGGECGAYLLDGYLVPGSYELYTSVPTSTLLKTGKVIPAPQGDIAVYEKFWEVPLTGIHPLILYADLMGTGDGRCREQAQRILSNELSYIQ